MDLSRELYSHFFSKYMVKFAAEDPVADLLTKLRSSPGADIVDTIRAMPWKTKELYKFHEDHLLNEFRLTPAQKKDISEAFKVGDLDYRGRHSPTRSSVSFSQAKAGESTNRQARGRAKSTNYSGRSSSGYGSSGYGSSGYDPFSDFRKQYSSRTGHDPFSDFYSKQRNYNHKSYAGSAGGFDNYNAQAMAKLKRTLAVGLGLGAATIAAATFREYRDMQEIKERKAKEKAKKRAMEQAEAKVKEAMDRAKEKEKLKQAMKRAV